MNGARITITERVYYRIAPDSQKNVSRQLYVPQPCQQGVLGGNQVQTDALAESRKTMTLQADTITKITDVMEQQALVVQQQQDQIAKLQVTLGELRAKNDRLETKNADQTLEIEKLRSELREYLFVRAHFVEYDG